MSGKFAPAREDGLYAYVVTETQFGRRTNQIYWASNIVDAKAKHGWTRQQHTSRTVRRATPADMFLPSGE